MTDEKGTPGPLKAGMKHKMHDMAEGQKMNDAGEQYQKDKMTIGLQSSKPHQKHQGKHGGHMTEDFKKRFIISL